MSQRPRFAFVVAAVVAALLLVLFRDALFGGRVLTPADMLLRHDPWISGAPARHVPGNPELADQVSQFLPWSRIVRERGVPLWNDLAAAGQPFLANMQSAVFSPFTALHRLLPERAALLAIAAAKLLLAAVFAALLARRLGASRAGAMLASLAFAFGGYQLLWLGHPHASAAAWLPLLLYLADLACAPREDRRPWWLGPSFAQLSCGV